MGLLTVLVFELWLLNRFVNKDSMGCLLVWGWTTFAAIGGFMFGYDIG